MIRFLLHKYLLSLILFLLAMPALAQNNKPASELQEEKHNEAMTILFYTRTISDASGNVRFDQNIVPNFKVARWLRMEVGLRHGERSGNIGAYDHYKVELQTKSFFDRTRLVLRMSDNVVRYGSPFFSRTNYLALAETKIPLTKKWEAVANVGYVTSYQKNDVSEVTPESTGSSDAHGIYKFGVKYKIHHGFFEGVWGSYDVFNPYALTQPFCQVAFDYELWKRGTLASYYRYQYNRTFDTPMNNFLGLGIRVRL